MTDQRSYSIRDDIHDVPIDMGMHRIVDWAEYDHLETKAASTQSAGVDPSHTFVRNGTIRYLLHPSMRETSIRTRGDVDHRFHQEDGGETHCKSMVFFNERVWHQALPPNPPVVPGEVWKFFDSNSFSVDLIGAIVSGGHNYDGTTTQANADINITASNTFILGKETSPSRHHLFYGYPFPTHPAGVKPTARRAGARGLISVIRESNNQTLHSIGIPSSMFGNARLQVVPIQKILREQHPGVSPGESIRVEYNMTSFGKGDPWTTCPSQTDDTITILVGALYGFAVLPLVKVE